MVGIKKVMVDRADRSYTDAAGAAVVGVGVGLAAEYAYENWVSDETREKIDDGLEAVGDAITFWD